jgi:uncharacterized protein YjbJ (UPF0337 family)
MAMGDDDKLAGKIDEAKGRLKKAWGEITNDPRRKAEGSMDKGKGKLEQIEGDLENAVDPDER